MTKKKKLDQSDEADDFYYETMLDDEPETAEAVQHPEPGEVSEPESDPTPQSDPDPEPQQATKEAPGEVPPSPPYGPRGRHVHDAGGRRVATCRDLPGRSASETAVMVAESLNK